VFSTIHARLYAALVASFCVLGLCLAFAQPIYALPDEPAHWLTANVRLEHLLGHTGCVPTVPGVRCSRLSICSAVPELQLTCAQDLGLYGDVLTYPGVLLSKLILPRQTESAIRQVQAIMLSRLLQGLLVLLCLLRVGVLARRTGRFGSLTLAAFTLSPLFAQQAFAVSSDGVQLGFGMYLFAAVMFWEQLSRLDVLAFVLLGYASTAKPTLLPLLVPAVFAAHWLAQVERAETRGLADLARGLLAALKPTRAPSPQTLILWSALLLSLLTIVSALAYDAADQATSAPEQNVARVAHLKELREHPLTVFELPLRLSYDPRQARFWAGPLGWLDWRQAPAVVNGFTRLLGLFAGLELLGFGWLALQKRGLRPGAGKRLACALPALLLGVVGVVVNVVFVSAVMYVLWTALDVARVQGVQQRYFFPATIVLIALVFRTLEALAARDVTASDLPLRTSTRFISAVAPFLVLALSLPYVARIYVDLSVHYHNPAMYPRP
jgi:Predicted membrane protein (DUF2142)